MPLAAISDWAALVPILLGVLGVCGLIFTALRYNRDDTTAIVTQQNTIVDEMKTINGELRLTSDSLRAERDELRQQVDRLTGEISALREEHR